jgi:hypothetical protein
MVDPPKPSVGSQQFFRFFDKFRCPFCQIAVGKIFVCRGTAPGLADFRKGGRQFEKPWPVVAPVCLQIGMDGEG